jgi:hypothetical protein
MNTYKITIECTSLLDLIYKDESLIKLINKFDYIQKAHRLYKSYYNENENKTEKKESLEFICECANIISEAQFKNFIETMHASEFYSFNNKIISLIKINTNYEIIYKYNFETLTKREIEERFKLKNKSTYHTLILYEKTNIRNNNKQQCLALKLK